jgi:mono/diheme cytochrome c family protein
MITRILVGAIVLFILIQFIPYGRAHTNPPVIAEPKWDSPQTRELFMRTCGNCHSNETKWPWYSQVAPVSWLVQNDVDEGREHLNVSAWGHQKKNKGYEAAEELQEGDMPPIYYLPTHPEAWLSDAEKKTLIAGLKATFGTKKPKD